LGFALRRYLAYQNVTCSHLCADMDNAGLVQLGQRRLAHIGDVCCDFLWTQLGITGHAGQFLNVDRSKAVVLNHTLGQHDGVFEVVTVPGHERHTHVLAKRKLTHVHRGTICQNISARDLVANLHQRTLVNTGILVGTRVLGQVVDVDTGIINSTHFSVIHTYDDTCSINAINDTATTCNLAHTRIARHDAFHSCTNKRLFRTQGRNSLTLHVGTHQSAVRVVVFQERNQGSSNGHHLTRGHIHQIDVVCGGYSEFVFMTHWHQIFYQHAVFIDFRVCLSDDVLTFLDCREIDNIIQHLTILDPTIGAFQEAVIVGTRKTCQRVDQTDVRTFRCFDRAHAAVMGGMNVTHFKTGTL